MRTQLDAWVDAHADEILRETQAILRIPSVEDNASASTDANAPFGKSVADALTHTLALCQRLGMTTENFGGYAGHAEFGSGNEIAAMLGHLDVVPPGSGWTHDPWGAEVSDGWIWGRGASDDKGPTFAALFGAKAVLDVTDAAGITLSRRIRLIFGCDEESGWQCMAHYFGAAGQPQPTVAFTPDAFFPLVYAEKGAFVAHVTREISASDEPLRVASFQSGLRANMVPDEAEALLVGEVTALQAAATALASHVAAGVTVRETPEGLRIYAKGRAAHGSTPQQGENAAAKLLRILSALPGMAQKDAHWMAQVAQYAAPDGSSVGIAGSDEMTGPLTCNLGIVTLESGTVTVTFNIRYPATWDGGETTGKFTRTLEGGGWHLAELSHNPPLYVPPDQEPVKTLLRVYREHTGDLRPPATMGGRTYATSVAPHGVAFGAAMPGDPEVAHQPDERFAVERLLQCAKIYAHALYELAR